MEEKIKFSLYLKKDTTEIRKLTTLYEKEQEYAPYLMAIEDSIVDEYIQNKKLKDKGVIKSLEKIKKNYDKDISFFNTELEKKIVSLFCDALEDRPITRHEMRLVFNYILWSIDNRNWMQDEQAYVKWITHSMGMMKEKEQELYHKEIQDLGKRLGLPEKRVNQILFNQYSEEGLMDENISIAESKFFALENEKKFDFIVKNFLENPYLFQYYVAQLLEEGNMDKTIKLYLEVLKSAPGFPPLELGIAELYSQIGQKSLALEHCNIAKMTLEQMPKDLMGEKERTEFFKLIEDFIKEND